MRKRIPTLLALILFISLIGFGLFLNYYQNNLANSGQSSLYPQNTIVANLADTSAAIVWQTSVPTIGAVLLEKQTFTDDRDDPQKPQPRLTHIVTLTGLTPNTSQNYQIKNDDLITPDPPLQFKTIPQTLAEQLYSTPALPPLRGTIIDSKLEPVDEAIIVLNYKNLSPKATFITTAGNFILPINRLLTTDLSNPLQIPENSPPTLEIRKGQTVSLVQITLPLKGEASILPPLTLGKNDNLTEFLALPLPSSQPLEFQARNNNFDLNNDGKINTLDSSFVSDLIKKRQFNNLADFNGDKVINNADLDLIKTQLK